MAESRGAKEVELPKPVRNRSQLALLGGEMGLSRGAERTHRPRALGLPLTLGIMPERDTREQLAGGRACFDRRDLLGGAERDATGAAAPGRPVLHDPRPAAARAQAHTKAGKLVVPFEVIVLAGR